MTRSSPVRPRRTAIAAVAAAWLCLAGTTQGATANGSAARPKRAHPSKAEAIAMRGAIPIGQLLCFPETAWISGLDRHYGVLVTQAACGGSVYVHQWLRRQAISPSASWETVAQRGGTIDHPAGCTKSPLVPADVRCL